MSAAEEFAEDLRAVDVLFPGPDYRTVLGFIQETLKPRTYLEIGVRLGDSLVLFEAADLAVGVDPSPAVSRPLPSHMHVASMTSEEFFRGGHAAAYFTDRPLDIVFIDGLHLSEQVLLDFVWTLPFLADGGTVLLHDVLPHRAEVASRTRQTTMWTGDCWRAALAIARTWPGFHFVVVPTSPSGLLAIRIAKPVLMAPARPLMEAFSELRDQPFDEAVRQEILALGAIPNAEADIRAAFSLNPD